MPMLYVFFCCRGCCSGCCKAISSALNALSVGILFIWNTLSDACGIHCACIIAPFLQPLGGYIGISLLFCMPILLYSYWSLGTSALLQCENVHFVNTGNMVLAAAHIIFGFYLQRRLVSGLQASNEESAEGDGATKTLSDQAWSIMLYDVGFCLYVPLFAGAFAFGIFGVHWTFQCSLSTWYIKTSSILTIVHHILATIYIINWWIMVSFYGYAETALRPLAGVASYGTSATQAAMDRVRGTGAAATAAPNIEAGAATTPPTTPPMRGTATQMLQGLPA